MKLITDTKPEVKNYALPLAVSKLDFATYSGARITVEAPSGPPPVAGYPVRAVTIVSLDDGSHHMVFDKPVNVRKHAPSEVYFDQLEKRLTESGEIARSLSRVRAEYSIPEGIEPVREEVFSQFGVSYTWTWWEVSW